MQTIQCTIVGDNHIGKTSLLVTYLRGYFPKNYVPNAIEPYSFNVIIDGKSITFSVWDIIWRDDEDRLHPYVPSGTNIILVCFSLVRPYTLDRVRTWWLPEILQCAPNVPFILVGTQSDLRQDPTMIERLHAYNMTPISYTQGLQAAQELHAINYLECSALTRDGLKDVFEEAIRAGLYHARRKRRPCGCIIL
jgi:small GTP-binding protein